MLGQQTKTREEVRRLGPFGSRHQALGFVVALLILLTLPLIVSPSREAAYQSLGRGPGTLHYHELFEEDAPLDVVVLGSSRTQYALDASWLERRLAERSGRPARALTLVHYAACAEVKYIYLKDLLARRRVRLVVLAAPPWSQEEPDSLVHRVAQLDEHWDDWSGLTAGERARFYMLNVCGTPRQVRFAAFPETTSPGHFHLERKVVGPTRGSYLARKGWNEPYRELVLEPPPLPRDQVLHRAENDTLRLDDVTTPYQRYFFRKIYELAATHGVKVVLLVVPRYEQRRETQAVVHLPADLAFGAGVPVAAVAPSQLFAGLDDATVRGLFVNDNHMNRNGSALFTRVTGPAILSALDAP